LLRLTTAGALEKGLLHSIKKANVAGLTKISLRGRG
jgi:hypothetical protein